MNNYKVAKIGLLNFWYFDDEEFNFSDGKLLLRGENGNGKTVTMQSFIPLILDGNRIPSRLDPFGSKEKKIEDYILGPSDGEQKDESISYLYMEVYNESLNKYITIGIGFRARKGRGTDFWGFALKDGKRIGIDFLLYKNYGLKVLLTKNELKSRIGTDNEFVETTKDYKSMVNRLLFGFNDLDSYDEFINVLLQLRSPKLSKDYTPQKLMGILSDVLQPLTQDDLKPLSEAIEDTNKTKEKIDVLKNQTKMLSNFLKAYQNYNEVLLYNKALAIVKEEENVKSQLESIKLDETKLKEAQARIEEIERNIESLGKEFLTNQTRLDAIDNSDIKKQASELENTKREIEEISQQIKILKDSIEKLHNREINTQNQISVIDNEISKEEREISDIINDITYLTEDICLNGLESMLQGYATSHSLDFQYIKLTIDRYRDKINTIKIKLEDKEKLDENLNRKQEEYEKIKKTIANIELGITREKDRYTSEIDTFKDKINKLNSENKVIKLNEDEIKEIFSYIDDYSSQSYIKAMKLYEKIGNHFTVQANSEKETLISKRDKLQLELQELQEELSNLQKSEELVFEQSQFDDESTSKLKELNIPYVSLYKAIEFKKEVSATDKNKIEELLIGMNILNAKIVAPKYFNKLKGINGIFLIPSTKKRDNLLQYFDIVSNEAVSQEEIANVLSSISIEDSEKIYLNKDKFQLDFILGFPGTTYESKYIGVLKRIEEQKRKISSKNKEIELKLNLISNCKNLIDNITSKIEMIDKERNLFPPNDTLEEIMDNINKLSNTYEIKSKDSSEIVCEVDKINQDIVKKLQELDELKQDVTVQLNIANLKKILSNIEMLNQDISDLKIKIDRIDTKNELKANSQITLENILEDIEVKKEDMSLKETALFKANSRKKAIESILTNPDNQKLLDELAIINKRQKEIPAEEHALHEEKGAKNSFIESYKSEVELKKERLNVSQLKCELKNRVFEREYNLGYVYTNGKKSAKEIIYSLKAKENSDEKNALFNYLTAINTYRNELLDYHIMDKEIFNNNEIIISEYREKGLSEEEITNILASGIRRDLTATYQGRVINILELKNCLDTAIIESENYITTQERHLFEDILLKTIGNKIRDKIDSSSEWVKNMNEIMNITQVDSNLSFQLVWRSKQAYTEEEMDTKELVRLFKIDASAIDTNDSNKLIEHFRSKIKQELEFSEKSHESYADIVSKVLDYRTWFEFKLFYKRRGSDKKELTNKVFNILSGGERAKSMYIPLFAAIYAKLQSASNIAMRLIALDEAFAGVDNTNIREMFAILDKLNLDYILTSQSLWGDYDTIKNLAICELIKDEQEKTVAIRHYKWNGKVITIMDKDSNNYE